MKTLKVLLAAILIAGFGLSVQAQQKKGAETVTFKTDIHCQNCAHKIESNIPFEKGVKDVKVNVESKEVTVVYDTKKTDVDKLKKALAKIDVNAEEVQPETPAQEVKE